MWITETGLATWHSAKPSWSGDGSSHRVPKMDGWLLTTENDPNLLFPPDPPGWISYFKIILFAPTSPRSGQTGYTSRTDVTALISLAVQMSEHQSPIISEQEPTDQPTATKQCQAHQYLSHSCLYMGWFQPVDLSAQSLWSGVTWPHFDFDWINPGQQAVVGRNIWQTSSQTSQTRRLPNHQQFLDAAGLFRNTRFVVLISATVEPPIPTKGIIWFFFLADMFEAFYLFDMKLCLNDQPSLYDLHKTHNWLRLL